MCLSIKKSLQYVFGQKDLIFRYRRWLELLKDYDMIILYLLGKANLLLILRESYLWEVMHMLRKARRNCLRKFIDLPNCETIYRIQAKVELRWRMGLNHLKCLKEKQHQDPILLELKVNVRNQKWLLKKGDMVCYRIKVDCVYQIRMNSNRGS